jgi:hypothetical protein
MPFKTKPKKAVKKPPSKPFGKTAAKTPFASTPKAPMPGAKAGFPPKKPMPGC